MKKNDVFELHISDMTNDGEGIGKTDGFVWFVKNAIPGDVLTVSAMKIKKNYGYARIVSVLNPSPDRVKPECEVFSSCGGCAVQCMEYSAQLRFKKNKVKNNICRIGGFTEEEIESIMSDTVGMDRPWRYRNKAIVAVGTDKSGKTVTGFYATHSHNIIPCKDCLLQPEEFSDIISDSADNSMSHILLRKSFFSGKTMAYAVSGIDNNSILSGDLKRVYGPDHIEEKLGDIKYKISPKSFFQVNPIQAEKLYKLVLEYSDLHGTETVWDLYCGTGSISLFLARQAAEVYGVEVVEDAVNDAVYNAEVNGISNARFYVGKAEEVIQRDDFKRPDVVVVDPPRKGCDIVCLETILKMSPDRVVYVSCDSATLARDLKILCSNGYDLKKITPVDMFPQTVHVETVVLLTRAE